jgi:hypothetical protein
MGAGPSVKPVPPSLTTSAFRRFSVTDHGSRRQQESSAAWSMKKSLTPAGLLAIERAIFPK